MHLAWGYYMAGMATLGSRDPDHIDRWVRALREGQHGAPRCTALRSDGCPCQRLRLKGSTKCAVHCIGRERDRVDAAAMPRLHRAAGWDNGVGRLARQRLEKIKRRQLNRAWAKDPTIPGSTVVLSDSDARRVRDYLLVEHGIALGGFCPATMAAWTPRAVDRLVWCGIHGLSGHVDRKAAAVRIACILRDEAAQAQKRLK